MTTATASSAPRGHHRSWVLPDGRRVDCPLALPGVRPRAYAVTVDGRYIGEVVRWRSAAPGRPGFSAGVWRARDIEGDWIVRRSEQDEEPIEWPVRGQAVDHLIEEADR